MKRVLVYGLSNQWGGVETIVVNLVSQLCDTYSFDIILPTSKCLYEEKLNLPNTSIVHMTMWGNNPLRFRHELISLLQVRTYDFAWVNISARSNILILKTIKQFSQAKIITHSHGASFESCNGIKSILLYALHQVNKNKFLQMVDILCACSQKAAIWLYGKDYVHNHNIHIVKNGIDYTKYKYNEETRLKVRNEMGIDAQTLVLFHAGRLTAVKNQIKLLEIAHYLYTIDKKVQLIIAGDGELRERLRQQAKELNIESIVSFIGQRDDIDQLMQAADVFLLPSLHEGFGIVLVEAQAAGLPCLASDTIPQETNITGSIRYLSLQESSASWANEICIHNIEKRSKISKRVEQSKYNIQTVVKDFITLLKE